MHLSHLIKLKNEIKRNETKLDKIKRPIPSKVPAGALKNEHGDLRTAPYLDV